MKELDNKKDFDIEYDPLVPIIVIDDDNIVVVESKSFVSMQGWDSDPDNDVYDFIEMYVTPPDTNVYLIPKVLTLMPQKVLSELNRHIVYSLSLGTSVTPAMGKDISGLVNMYRITIDDWDLWEDVKAHFDVTR
ncbi:hypothetical protein JHK85_007342 [Glycine max]|nr:hypothetical protein JHK85_007342 [Glycine max]KAG5071921.1 hypothetical protein JHK86_007132 [Glycine max]KAH1069437.1 hypothetical protein GYH30_006876 [Glycine max]